MKLRNTDSSLWREFIKSHVIKTHIEGPIAPHMLDADTTVRSVFFSIIVSLTI